MTMVANPTLPADPKSGHELDSFSTPTPAGITPYWAELLRRQHPLVLDADHPADAHFFWPGTRDWHRATGQTISAGIPLLMGDEPLGFIGITFPPGTTRCCVSAEGLDLAQAAAALVALAIKLTEHADTAREAALASAVLAERNRIARDLHDTLAQGFAGVITQLGAAEGASEIGDHEQIRHSLERARDLAKLSLAEARTSVHALREQAAAAPLAERFTRMFTAMTQGTRLEGTVEEDMPLGRPSPLTPALDWCAHKFAQETLANAIKHSGARHYRLRIEWAEDAVVLHASDDGVGFDLTAPRTGFGLLGMRERAAECRGEVTLESAAGAGTRLTLKLPLA